MKKALTHALTTLALIMAFSLAVFADNGHVAPPDGTDAAGSAARQTAEGPAGLRNDGHWN